MNVTVISDASYCPDHRVAGYGYWIACARRKVGGGGQIVHEVGDVNTAEMMALANTLWHGISEQIILPGDTILFQTDSLGAIDRLQNIKRVATTEQQKTVQAYFEKTISRLDLAVQFRHVKGHTVLTDARYVANRMCDKRAREQMRAARKAKVIEKARAPIQDIFL